MAEPGRWRGRVTRRQNAVLVVLVALSVPLVIGLFRVDSGGTRQVILAAYFIVFLMVAIAFRLSFERSKSD